MNLERDRVGRANHREASAIWRRQLYEPESFGGCDDPGIDHSKWEIPIANNQLCNPDPGAGLNGSRNQGRGLSRRRKRRCRPPHSRSNTWNRETPAASQIRRKLRSSWA
jgi:hypothetical protein